LLLWRVCDIFTHPFCFLGLPPSFLFCQQKLPNTMDFFYIYGHFPIQYILYVHFPLWTFSDSSNFYGHFITMDNSPYGFFTHRFWIPRSKQLYDCVSFWCKFCYVERNLPSLVWNKVKVFKNVGATVVVPVAPVVTSLKHKRFLDYFGRSVFNFKLI
jgi:hypothetical protein